MLGIIGICLTIILVFGAYTLSGGSIGVVLASLPFELMMIGGACVGAFIISNKKAVLKKVGKEVVFSFKGPRWKKQDYLDLLCLLYIMVKTIRSKGILALEEQIEHPENSAIFGIYPRIAQDPKALLLICDTIRIIALHLEEVNQIEDALEKKIRQIHHENSAVSTALTNTADGLPALGIVAAVLGVIKTMASVDKPPQILGGMIAGALVGTFLGVFLSYCLVGPIASKLKTLQDQDHHFYLVIRDIIIAHLNDNPPQVSVELGRGNIPSEYQPTFVEVESALSEIKSV